MDPLLKSLQSKELGPFIGTTFAGAFIHADDIQTISSSQATLQAQISVWDTGGLGTYPLKEQWMKPSKKQGELSLHSELLEHSRDS